jgi:flagellar biosynthesis/type III secretory pathway ATPase
MPQPRIDWPHLQAVLRQTTPYALTGRVQEMVGLVITSRGPESAVGRICEIEMPPPEEPITAEVVGFRQGEVLLMPQGEVRGVRPHARVVLQAQEAMVQVGRISWVGCWMGWGGRSTAKAPSIPAWLTPFMPNP